MTSITDVYEGDTRRVASRRRRLLGTGIFTAGAGMVVTAIALATTALGVGTFGRYGARELAGVFAGLGLPAVVLGVFVVLPASRHTRSAAGIGTSLAVLGVALFQHAYPYNWVEAAPLFALGTAGVYFAGVATTVWCLFVALATFKTRRDPGGTATMEITEEGRIRLVEEARSLPGMGGVGLFGQDPDGSVATQTNRPDGASSDHPGTGAGTAPSGDGGATVLKDDANTAAGTTAGTASASSGSGTASPTTDGGSSAVGGGAGTGSPSGTATGPSSDPAATGGATAGASESPAPDVTDDAEFLDAARERGRPDAYCGNCGHFEYVKVDGDIEPYCGFTGTLMEDMDACEEWSPAESA